MKGLIIKTNIAGDIDRLEVAISEGFVEATFNITRNEGYWNVGGLKMPEGIHYSWKGGTLQPGDEVLIEFTDVEKSDPHTYEESHTSLKERMIALKGSNNTDNKVWQQKIELYNRLKSLLEKENLI